MNVAFVERWIVNPVTVVELAAVQVRLTVRLLPFPLAVVAVKVTGTAGAGGTATEAVFVYADRAATPPARLTAATR